MKLPGAINQRWSLDFVADALSDGRRFRILCIVDDFSRECLATVVDTSLGGMRVVRELDRLNSRLRDKCLNEHAFLTLAEAREAIEAWRYDYNHLRPHSSLGALTPTEFAMPKEQQQQPPLEGQNHDRLYLRSDGHRGADQVPHTGH